VVFPALWRRIPSLRLAVDESELDFLRDEAIYGLRSLPVRW
jgi:hypothetical protein